MKLFNDDYNYHQPFIFYDWDKTYLIYTRCERYPHKIYVETGSVSKREFEYNDYEIFYCEIDLLTGKTGEEKRINTGFNHTIHCSPYAYLDYEGNIRMTFIIGNILPKGKIVYKLWKMFGKTLDQMYSPTLDNDTFGLKPWTGFENNEYKLIANTYMENSFIIFQNKFFQKKYKVAFKNIPYIRRVGYSTIGEHDILITCPTRDPKFAKGYNLYGTYLYNLDSKYCSEMLVDGKPLYKSTIHGKYVVYSKYTGTKDNYKMELHLGKAELKEKRLETEWQNYR